MIALLLFTDGSLVGYLIRSHQPIIAIRSLHEINEQGLKRIAAVKGAATKLVSVQSDGEAIPLSSPSSQKRVSSSFVTTSGTNLMLNGKIFRSIGVNRYNLLTQGGSPYVGCGGVFSDSMLSIWFSELKKMGVTSVRFWLFQSFTKSGTDFSRFDQVLNLASRNGIRVIPVFENQWKDCTEGGYKTASWYQDGYLHPYGNYPISYKAYVTKVVTAYKDNPTIMFWQLINEAETDHTALYAFAKDMSSEIKSIDHNHLVSLGTMGNGQKGAQEGQYRTLHAIPTIDVVEYHDYHHEEEAFPNYDNYNSLAVRFNDAKALNKPIIIGESGIKSGCREKDCYSKKERARLFNAKLDQFFGHGGAVYLFWSYRDTNHQTGDGFTIEATDPLVNIIKKYADKL